MSRQQPAEPSAEPTLRLRGVGRRFGGVQAVRDVDLDVAHGERRAILGPNGAGKTTLFNLVAGDFPPSAGHDRGARPGRHRTCRRASRPKLGLARTLPAVAALPRALGRGQHLPRDRRPSTAAGCGRSRRAATARSASARDEAAERVALGDKLGQLVGDLSHGEQRQLEVGMASAVEPQADDARRACVRALARRARAAHRAAARRCPPT